MWEEGLLEAIKVDTLRAFGKHVLILEEQLQLLLREGNPLPHYDVVAEDIPGDVAQTCEVEGRIGVL